MVYQQTQTLLIPSGSSRMERIKFEVSNRMLEECELTDLKKYTDVVYVYYQDGDYILDKSLVDAYTEGSEATEEEKERYRAHEHFKGTPGTMYAHIWESAYVCGFRMGLLLGNVKFIVNSINYEMEDELIVSIFKLSEEEFTRLIEFARQVKEEKLQRKD